jgi:hypothetical protein
MVSGTAAGIRDLGKAQEGIGTHIPENRKVTTVPFVAWMIFGLNWYEPLSSETSTKTFEIRQ